MKNKLLINILFNLFIVFGFLVIGYFLYLKINKSKTLQPKELVNGLIKASKIQFDSEKRKLEIPEVGDSLLYLVLHEEELIILRIKDTYCEACINQAINDFLNLRNSIPPGKMLVLSTYSNERDFKLLRQRIEPVRVFNIDPLDIPAEEFTVPYFFIIDKRLESNLVLLYLKEYPERTNDYFNAVVNLLGN
jgi:hypothetical protein